MEQQRCPKARPSSWEASLAPSLVMLYHGQVTQFLQNGLPLPASPVFFLPTHSPLYITQRCLPLLQPRAAAALPQNPEMAFAVAQVPGKAGAQRLLLLLPGSSKVTGSLFFLNACWQGSKPVHFYKRKEPSSSQLCWLRYTVPHPRHLSRRLVFSHNPSCKPKTLFSPGVYVCPPESASQNHGSAPSRSGALWECLTWSQQQSQAEAAPWVPIHELLLEG